MPKSKKSEDSSDSDTSVEDRNPPPKKKSKEAEKPKEDGPKEWVLEKMRKVTISEFRGRKNIDIREYYEKDGKCLPGKKGISLSLTQWKKLLECADEISAAAED